MTAELTPLPEDAPYRFIGMTDVWLIARTPDGMSAEGCGATTADALADAMRRWRRWKRAHAGKLAVDGHEYRRRMRARARRRRA